MKMTPQTGDHVLVVTEVQSHVLCSDHPAELSVHLQPDLLLVEKLWTCLKLIEQKSGHLSSLCSVHLL